MVLEELHEELGLSCLKLQVLVFPLVSEGYYVVEYAYEESRCLKGAQHHLVCDLNHSSHRLDIGEVKKRVWDG